MKNLMKNKKAKRRRANKLKKLNNDRKKINFYQIFRVNTDGSIETLRSARIGGTQMSRGVRIGRGVSFGGIDLLNFIGRDFQVENESGILILLGIF